MYACTFGHGCYRRPDTYTKLLCRAGNYLYADLCGHAQSTDPSSFGSSTGRFGTIAPATLSDPYTTALVYADSSDYVMGTSAFTIDVWIYFSTLPTKAATLYFAYQAGSVPWSFGMYRGTGGTGGQARLTFNANGTTINGTLATGNMPATSTWYHYVVSRSGSSWYFFINGTGAGTATQSADLTDTASGLGAPGASASNAARFVFSDLRVTIGRTLWTADFTPPKRRM